MKKSLIMVILLSGCASPGIDRADQNQVVKRYYASVESMQKVTLSSEVGTGIAAGAGFGFVDSLDGNKEEMIGGAIVGGLVGGLFTALFEGVIARISIIYMLLMKVNLPLFKRKSSIKTQNVCSSMLPTRSRSLLQIQAIVKRV